MTQNPEYRKKDEEIYYAEDKRMRIEKLGSRISQEQCFVLDR